MADAAFSRGVLIPRPFCYGQLAATDTLLYTAPATATGCFAIIKEIWIANTDGASHTITFYVVEAGGSAAANRMIIPGIAIAPNTLYRLSCATVLGSALVSTTLTGDTIWGKADSATKVSYRISGVISV